MNACIPKDELMLCKRLGLVRETGVGDYELTGAGVALLAPHAPSVFSLQGAPNGACIERARAAFASRHDFDPKLSEHTRWSNDQGPLPFRSLRLVKP